jgi:hypothetical protein
MRDAEKLDLLLDAALKTYADPEFELGLEARVLARIADARPQQRSIRPTQRRLWLPWAVALAAAAVILPALLLRWQPRRPSVDTTQQAAHSRQDVPGNRQKLAAETSAVSPIPGTTMHLRSLRSRLRESQPPVQQQVAVASPLPKKDVFPTPQPLSAQERALFVVATQTPAPLREALVKAQTEDNPPVHIAAIHIPPLESLDPDQP